MQSKGCRNWQSLDETLRNERKKTLVFCLYAELNEIVIIDLTCLICDLMFMLRVCPPGAGEQNKGPAGQIWRSEERGFPETTGSQVYYLAVVQWAGHTCSLLTLPCRLKQVYIFTLWSSSWRCLFVLLYIFSGSFGVLSLSVLIRSGAAESFKCC